MTAWSYDKKEMDGKLKKFYKFYNDIPDKVFVRFCLYMNGNLSVEEFCNEVIKCKAQSHISKVGHIDKKTGKKYELRSNTYTVDIFFDKFLSGDYEKVEKLFDLCELMGIAFEKEWYGDLRKRDNSLALIRDFLDRDFQDRREEHEEEIKKSREQQKQKDILGITYKCKKHCQEFLAKEKADDIDSDLLSFVEGENGTVTPINKVLDNPDNRHILIYGPGAMGKTTALINFAKSKLDGQQDEIPIIIQLKNAPGTDEYDKLYVNDGKAESTWLRRSSWEVITNNPRVLTCNFSEFSSKMDNVFNDAFANNFYLLFDATDEAIKEGTDGKIRNKQIQGLICEEITLLSKYPNLHIIVTSRFDESNRLPETFRKFKVCGFDKDKVLAILSKKKNSYSSEKSWAREILDKKIAAVVENARLTKILASPLCLKLYVAVEHPEDNYKNINAEGELFYWFFHDYEKKHAARSGIPRKDCLNQEMCSFVLDFILPAFAWDGTSYKDNEEDPFNKIVDLLTENEKGSYGFKHVCGHYGKIAFSEYEDIESTAKKFVNISKTTIKDYCEKELRVLSKGFRGFSRFSHPVIRTYFKAYYVFTRIKLAIAAMRAEDNEMAYKIVSEILREKSLEPDIIRYVSEIIGEYKNASVYSSVSIEWRKYNDGINADEKQGYIEKLLRLFRDKEVPEGNYALYNLIEILKTREDLSDVDFRDLDLKNARLNGYIFGHPGLAAQFDGAHLSPETILPSGHISEIRAIAFKNDSVLLSVDIDGEMKEWDITTGRCLETKLLPSSEIGEVFYIKSNPIDPKIIVIGSINGTWIVDLKTTIIKPLDYSGMNPVFNNNGELLAVGILGGVNIYQKKGDDYEFIKCLMFDNYDETDDETYYDTVSIEFNPKDNNQLLAFTPVEIKIWNNFMAEKPKSISEDFSERFIWSATYSPDGQEIAVLAGKNLIVLDSALNEVRKEQNTNSSEIKYLPNGFAVKSVNKLIKTTNKKEKVLSDWVNFFDVNKNGDIVAVSEKTIEIFYRDGSSRSIKDSSFSVKSAIYSNDGKNIYAATEDGLKIFKVLIEGEGIKLKYLDTILAGENLEGVELFGKNKLFVHSEAGSEIINLNNFTANKILNLPSMPMSRFVLNQKRDKILLDLVVGHAIWNGEDWKKESDYKEIPALMEEFGQSLNYNFLSSDEKFAIEFEDRKSKLINVYSGRCLDEITVNFQEWTFLASFNNSETEVALAGFVIDSETETLEYIVKVYRIENEKLIDTQTVLQHNGLINSVRFSPDDKFIVTASDDGNIKIWSAINGEFLGGVENMPGLYLNGVTFDEKSLENFCEDEKEMLKVYGARINAEENN